MQIFTLLLPGAFVFHKHILLFLDVERPATWLEIVQTTSRRPSAKLGLQSPMVEGEA